jgi:hypothetical protein
MGDLLSVVRIPWHIFISQWVIQLLQTFSYLAIYSSAGDMRNGMSAGHVDVVTCFIFASVSFAVTAMIQSSPLIFVSVSYWYLSKSRNTLKDKSVEWDKELCFSMVVRLWELLNLFWLVTTSVNIVPRQESPLDIVLNCTALLVISQLSEAVNKVWRFKLRNVLVVECDKQEYWHGRYL